MKAQKLEQVNTSNCCPHTVEIYPQQPVRSFCHDCHLSIQNLGHRVKAIMPHSGPQRTFRSNFWHLDSSQIAHQKETECVEDFPKALMNNVVEFVHLLLALCPPPPPNCL